MRAKLITIGVTLLLLAAISTTEQIAVRHVTQGALDKAQAILSDIRQGTLAEAQEMYKDAQTTSLAESYDIWVSDKGNREGSGVIYGIRNDYAWSNTANKNASLTDKAGVWCVAD